MEAKDKGGDFVVRTHEIPDLGKLEALERDCGEYIEVANVKGVIFNIPGHVAAFGGIPDELKIDGGISFLIPCPTFKYPKHLSEDPLQAFNVLLRRGYRETHEHIRSTQLIWNKEWDYGDDIHEQPTMLRIEVNMTPTLGIWKGLGFCWNPVGAFIQTYKIQTDCGEQYVRLFRAPDPASDVVFYSFYSGDVLIVAPHSGIIVDQPQFVAAVGCVPDEHKISGGLSFSITFPVFKFPTRLIEDPIERRTVDSWNDSLKELCRIQFLEAYHNAVNFFLRCPPIKCGSMDSTDHLGIIQVNIGTRYFRKRKRGRKNDAVELFDTMWSSFSHSIMPPAEEKTTQLDSDSSHKIAVEDLMESVEEYVAQHDEIIGVCLGPELGKEIMEWYAYNYLVVRQVCKPLPTEDMHAAL